MLPTEGIFEEVRHGSNGIHLNLHLGPAAFRYICGACHCFLFHHFGCYKFLGLPKALCTQFLKHRPTTRFDHRKWPAHLLPTSCDVNLQLRQIESRTALSCKQWETGNPTGKPTGNPTRNPPEITGITGTRNPTSVQSLMLTMYLPHFHWR